MAKTTLPDYLGCGPFRFTTTKQHLSPILGLEGYKNIVRQMQENSVRIPIVAIGGIAKEDIAPIMACNVNGIALSGSVLNAINPVKEMEEIKKMIF